jgi:hypothetical protein
MPAIAIATGRAEAEPTEYLLWHTKILFLDIIFLFSLFIVRRKKERKKKYISFTGSGSGCLLSATVF